jgi:hypothetical protein
MHVVVEGLAAASKEKYSHTIANRKGSIERLSAHLALITTMAPLEMGAARRTT